MIALISDVHGNYFALSEVLRDIERLGIKDIYCLGDISGYYPQINECCDELRNAGVNCIIGNHDWYMISNSQCLRSKSANFCINYQRKIIRNDNLIWLSSLPVHRFIMDLSMVHGGWQNPIDEYLHADEEYFYNFPNKFFASGHTHKQIIKNFGLKTYCNPGSVGQPRDGDPRAAYATFDGVNFDLHRVEYDVDAICELMNGMGFDSYYYERLRSGSANFIK